MKCIPDYVQEILRPLDGVMSMLELGNKRNAEGAYKQAFASIGIRHTSVDWNGLDGALKLDLRKPLGLGTFDMVTNFGTSEHVSEQEPCWRNIHGAVKVGGVLVGLTPLPGDWTWHGEWYPTEEWYAEFAARNGYDVERLYVHGVMPRRDIMYRLRKSSDRPFVMPSASLMYRNH